MDTTKKPTRKKPLVAPRIKSRVINSFEVDDIELTSIKYNQNTCVFNFWKEFSKPDKYNRTKSAGVIINLINKAKKPLTKDTYVEDADTMEIRCVNGKYVDGDFEDGKYIIRSTVSKKTNPVLFDNILATLVKIHNTVEETNDSADNVQWLIGDHTKRVRIDVSAVGEYMRKDDDDRDHPDLLITLDFNLFVKDL